MSISTMQGSASSRSHICSTQNVHAAATATCGGGSVDVTAAALGGAQSNVFLRCLPAVAAVATGAGGLKNAFVIVQITRFEQVIGVFTIQAPTEALKVPLTYSVDYRARNSGGGFRNLR